MRGHASESRRLSGSQELWTPAPSPVTEPIGPGRLTSGQLGLTTQAALIGPGRTCACRVSVPVRVFVCGACSSARVCPVRLRGCACLWGWVYPRLCAGVSAGPSTFVASYECMRPHV